MIKEFYMLINIIKDNYDVRNLFRLKKETNDTAVQDEGNLFRIKKENKTIKNRVIRDVRNLLDMNKKVIINQ